MIRFAALTLIGLLSLPASADTVITDQIEPTAWSNGPRHVALRCAGLLDVLLSVQPSTNLHAAQSLLLVEGSRLAEKAGAEESGVTELKAFSEAYLALPQEQNTQRIIASDMESCGTFVQVLQGAKQ